MSTEPRRRRRRERPQEPTKRSIKPEYRPAGVEQPSDAPSPTIDPELARVWSALQRLQYCDVLPDVLRATLDQVYDGQRTGRWDYEQLNKNEKTHIGTLVEINLQKALELPDTKEPKQLDYLIDGVEVDCKWSRVLNGWEIPREMYEYGPKLALLVWANDYTSRWATGLVRITEDNLRPPGNQRDGKRRLSEKGIQSITWLGLGEMVGNTLLNLSTTTRQQILAKPSGQAAVTEMFRALEGVLVNRATVLTVAQQDDSAKRVRDARIQLAPKGFVIFGHYAPHPEWAETLGLPRPWLGQFVSAHLSRAVAGDPESSVIIAGERWRRARPGEKNESAPKLPRQGAEPPD